MNKPTVSPELKRAIEDPMCTCGHTLFHHEAVTQACLTDHCRCKLFTER